MSLTISNTGRWIKAAAAAAAVTFSLGAATLATVEPAQAGYYVDGFRHPHYRVYHRFGFRHPGFAYRPLVHPYFHRYGMRPYWMGRGRFHGYGFGYGYHHGLPRAWGHYDWHHRIQS